MAQENTGQVVGDLPIVHSDGTITYFGLLTSGRQVRTLPVTNINEAELENNLANDSLPLASPDPKLLAWGPNCLAFRFTALDNPMVGVLGQRAYPNLPFNQAVPHGWQRDREIAQLFPEFTIPQSLVITQGVNPNRPATLKISPEVCGITLKEAGFLNLAYNPELLQQWIDFTSRRLGHFIRSGDLVDVNGYIHKNFTQLLINTLGLFPFASANLMVDYPTNRLVLVDCGPYENFWQTSKRSKAVFMSQAATAGVGIGVAKGLVALNQLKDHLFYQPTTKHDVERNDPTQDKFKDGVVDAIDILNRSGMDYRIVGSLATAAAIQNRGGDYYLTSQRADGTARDIDVVVMSGDEERLFTTDILLKRGRISNSAYPEVSLHPVLREGHINESDFKRPRLPTVYTRIAVKEDGMSGLIVYRDVKKELPLGSLERFDQTYDGVTFPSLKTGVLAGLTLTRVGGFRPKDIQRIPLLKLGPNEIPRQCLDFNRELRATYPYNYRITMLREAVAHMSGGFLLGGRIRRGLKDITARR